MMGVLFFVGAIVVGLGLAFAGAVWLMSRFDSALAVTYRRPRR